MRTAHWNQCYSPTSLFSGNIAIIESSCMSNHSLNPTLKHHNLNIYIFNIDTSEQWKQTTSEIWSEFYLEIYSQYMRR